MTHYKWYKMKRKMIPRMGEVLKLGYLTHNMTRYRLCRELRDRLGANGAQYRLPWEMECLPRSAKRSARLEGLPEVDEDWRPLRGETVEWEPPVSVPAPVSAVPTERRR